MFNARWPFIAAFIVSLFASPMAFSQQGFKFHQPRPPQMPPEIQYCNGKMHTLNLFFTYRKAGIEIEAAKAAADAATRVMIWNNKQIGRNVPETVRTDVANLLDEIYTMPEPQMNDRVQLRSWFSVKMDECVREMHGILNKQREQAPDAAPPTPQGKGPMRGA